MAGIVLINVFVAVVLLELALHLYNPLPSSVKHNKVILHANNRIQLVHERSDKLQRSTTFSTNSLGFRGPEPPADFDRFLTLVAIGGSTTEEFFSDGDRTWPARLHQRLGTGLRNVWLNNAGIAGHSTLGHIVLVRDYLAKLRPKVAIFLVGLNDVDSEGDFEALEHSYNFLYNTTQASWRQRLFGYALKSEIVSAGITIKRRLRATELALPYDRDFDVRSAPSREVTEAALQARLEAVKTRMIPPYVRRLERLIRECQASGILPIFVTQPALYGSGSDPVTGVDLESIRVGQWNGKAAWAVLELYNQALKDTGARNGLLVVDLARQLPKRSDFYYDLVHHTDAGNDEIARIVAGEIRGTLEEKVPRFRRASGGVDEDS